MSTECVETSWVISETSLYRQLVALMGPHQHQKVSPSRCDNGSKSRVQFHIGLPPSEYLC